MFVTIIKEIISSYCALYKSILPATTTFMTSYFIKDGDHECGPFTIDQLRLKLLNKETPVWYAALKEWTSAGNVYELKELFNSKLSSNSIVKSKLSKIWGNNLLKQQIKKIS